MAPGTPSDAALATGSSPDAAPASTSSSPDAPLAPASSPDAALAPAGRKLLRLEVRNAETPIERKPNWIKTKAKMGPEYSELKSLVKREGLHTVCEEAGCPNIYECWEDREATFLIGGTAAWVVVGANALCTCVRTCASECSYPFIYPRKFPQPPQARGPMGNVNVGRRASGGDRCLNRASGVG